MRANLGKQIEAGLKSYAAVDDIFRRSEEDVARRELRDREKQRFEFERKRSEREDARAAEEDQLRSQFNTLEDSFRNRSGDFSAFAPEGAAAPVAAPQAGAEAAPASAPVRRALQAPGTEAAPAPAAPAAEGAPAESGAATNMRQFFNSDPAKLYGPNAAAAEKAYYQQLGSLMRRSYVAKGDYARAAMVDNELEKLQEARYEPARRAAAAAALTGTAPEDLNPLLSKVYGAVNDGRGVKVTGMKVDPKSNMPIYSMEFAGKDGKATSRELTGTQLYGLLQTADAFNVLKFNVESGFKGREVAARETSAGADVTRANAYAATARDNAETNRDTRRTNNVIRERAQDVKDDESASRMFSNAFGIKEIEVKTKDEVEAMLPKQREAYESQRREQTQRRELSSYAQGIYSLNERKVAPAQITQLIPVLRRRISEGKGADGVDEATGLPFVNFNGKKVLLPKD
jgi:hypothetical protein